MAKIFFNLKSVDSTPPSETSTTKKLLKCVFESMCVCTVNWKQLLDVPTLALLKPLLAFCLPMLIVNSTKNPNNFQFNYNDQKQQAFTFLKFAPCSSIQLLHLVLCLCVCLKKRNCSHTLNYTSISSICPFTSITLYAVRAALLYKTNKPSHLKLFSRSFIARVKRD